jgi:hypothetical protein
LRDFLVQREEPLSQNEHFPIRIMVADQAYFDPNMIPLV